MWFALPCAALSQEKLAWAGEVAVVARYRDHRQARHGVAAVREVAVALLSLVLDAHEQGPSVHAPGYSNDLALSRTHQEATDLAGDRVFVVALAGESLGIGVVSVGLDPQHAVTVEGEVVGGVEHVGRVDVRGAGRSGPTVIDRDPPAFGLKVQQT